MQLLYLAPDDLTGGIDAGFLDNLRANIRWVYRAALHLHHAAAG
jgi:hypothetical protein